MRQRRAACCLGNRRKPEVSVMFLSYGQQCGSVREYIHIITHGFAVKRSGCSHIFISNERECFRAGREGYPKLLGEIDFDMNSHVYGLITARLSGGWRNAGARHFPPERVRR